MLPSLKWEVAARGRALTWEGPGLTTDSRPTEKKPLEWVKSLHCLGAYEVPFLPEARSTASGGKPNPAELKAFFDRASMYMRRMLSSLHLPGVRTRADREKIADFPTFELRIVREPGAEAQSGDPAKELASGSLRLFILCKMLCVPRDSVTSWRGDNPQLLRAHGLKRLEAIMRLVANSCPVDLSLERVQFPEDSEVSSPGYAIGLRSFEAHGELRRGYVVSPQLPVVHDEALEPDKFQAFSAPWPLSDVDLVATAAALMAVNKPAAYAVRIIPTLLTPCERELLLQTTASVGGGLATAAKLAGDLPVQIDTARKHALALLRDPCLFESVVQIVSDDADSLWDLLNAIGSEHAQEAARARDSAGAPVSPILALNNNRDVARSNHNWVALERVPWGVLSQAEEDKAAPAGVRGSLNGVDKALYGVRKPDERVKMFEFFRHRDLQISSENMRLRRLMTSAECSRVWRLPLLLSGGIRGLSSRAASPFDQLPKPVDRVEDSIDLGLVQYRNMSSGQRYLLPFMKGDGEQAGISDRAIVVAGSPGSGKTNLCLTFLEQMWKDSGEEATPVSNELRFPYLVVDPTRGNEFRYLLKSAPETLLVFTVGDERANPLCFNPFVVPVDVSIQGHISRVMSCFKAAYHMWDPLPAIFELAIREAYVRKFRERGVPERLIGGKRVPWEPFGTGRLQDYPTISDLCRAMGAPDQKGSVLHEQAVMWGADPESGGTTENAATIVASTSLRLNNLRENYESIIGGGEFGRECVDLAELLERPVVLEMGMIGDSQALSLLMGFLVVCLTGNIENRTRSDRAREMGLDERGRDPVGRHMLVLEEAHRLLVGEGAGGGGESGNSRAKAAEDLNEMLAEVRKYGQGVMILDQRPGSLVGGVIDNAYVIAMHRLNEKKSFEQFSKILSLNSEQERYARSELRPGEMVLFDRASRIPVIVRPAPLEKSETGRLLTRALELCGGSEEELLKRASDIGAPSTRLGAKGLDEDVLLAIIMRPRTKEVLYQQATVDSGTEESPKRSLLLELFPDEQLSESLEIRRRELANLPADSAAPEHQRYMNGLLRTLTSEISDQTERRSLAAELLGKWGAEDESLRPQANLVSDLLTR